MTQIQNDPQTIAMIIIPRFYQTGETICSSMYVPIHGKLLDGSGVCALFLQHTDDTPLSTGQEATFLLQLCNGATFFSFQDSAIEVARAPCSVYFQHMAEGLLLNTGQSFSAIKLYECSSVCVHACLCMGHAWVYKNYTCLWRPGFSTRYLLLSICTLSFEGVSGAQPGAHQFS